MRRSANLLGFVVMIVGLVLLLNNLNLVDLGWHRIWPVFPLLLGLSFFVKFVQSKDKGILIPATLFSGVSIFFFMFTTGALRWEEMSLWWPVFPLVLGLGFLLAFLADIRDTGLLVPAAIFLVIGGVFLAENNPLTRGYLKYWPVIIVAAGLFMFVGNLFPETQEKKEPELIQAAEPGRTDPPVE